MKKKNIEMENFKRIIWLFLSIFLITTENPVISAKLYVLDDINLQNTSTQYRVYRQTHPASTIAQLPPQENGAFVPIVGPTQSLSPQQQIPFSQPNEFFSNGEFLSSLQGVPNTLVDYLVPPSPDTIGTSFNFQDAAANLQQVENGFDNPSPTSTSNHLPLSNSISPSPLNFLHQNQINPPIVQTARSNFTTGPVPSVLFQNANLIPSSTPILIPTNPTPPSNVTNFLSNKISNPLSRETFAYFNNPNRPKPNLFNFPPNPSTPQYEKLQQPNQTKWQLGYDPNEILVPPRDESFSQAYEYDTNHDSRFRRPSSDSTTPLTTTEHKSSNPVSPTTSQLFSQFIYHQQQPQQQLDQVNQFNQFSPPQNAAHNEPFILIPNQFTSSYHLPTTHENTNEQQNVIWGTLKQPYNNFNPTTSSPPFLPTATPNKNLSSQQIPFQQQPNFQNPQHAPYFSKPQFVANFQNLQTVFNYQRIPLATNFQTNDLNSVPLTSPPPPTYFGSQPFFDLNQNHPLDSQLMGQSVLLLPQGTVADHTFQSFNDNPRQFKKRQVNEEEGNDQQHEEEPQPNYSSLHATRPVYSFVKTDRDGHFKWSVRHTSKR